MDFSFKSKLWAGNIYHQFESICQDVDGFVNKDSVKFVENQVQSVGMSVRRLYSNVVQDILPLSVDTLKPERQVAQICQHFKEQGNSLVQNSEDDCSVEKNVTEDLKQATSVSDSEIISGKLDKDISQNSDESSSVEKNVTENLEQATSFSSYDSEIFSGKLDNGISSSLKFSAHEECSTSIEKERKDLNHQEGDEGFSDDTVSLSDASGIACFSKRKLLMVEDPYLDVDGSLSPPPTPVSTPKDNCVMMDSPLSLPEGCSTEDENVDLSTSTQSSEDAFSYHSWNEKEEKMTIMPSAFCTSPKSSIAMESTYADSSEEGNNDLHSPSLLDGCTYNTSAVSFVSTAVPTNEPDVDRPSLITESFYDNDALQNNRSESVVGSFESRHEEHYEPGLPKIAISSSETEDTYAPGVPIGGLDLETVELSSDVKHAGRSVVSDSNYVVPGSYRRKDFGYYKKLIQGAFTSQKRLSKEYEHLAIMYGDIEVESIQHFEPSSLSPFPSTALHSEETQSGNEWELL